MPIIYRTTPNDNKSLLYLEKLGQDNWIYCGQLGDKLVFRKEEKRVVSKKEITTGTGFEQWYRIYPNKKSRKDAEVMWNRLSEGERELALSGLHRYIAYWKKKQMDKQYMPHPATWLNAKRWEDDLSDTVVIAPTKSEEIIKKELDEEKQIEQAKREMNEKIRKIKQNPEEWNKIVEMAKSKLTPEQKESSIFNALLDQAIRQLLSNYK